MPRLSLSLIVRDPEIQPREAMDHETVTQYAEDMVAGIEFPPVVVYFDGERNWLSRGFHRCEAAEAADLEEIEAEVREGTRSDALWDAVGSNKEHDTGGKRRSNADKRRAVEMAIRARPDLSDRELARHVGVGNQMVGHVRSSICVIHTDNRTVTRNGSTYTMQTAAIGRPTAVANPPAADDPDSDDDDTEDEPSDIFACPACGEAFDADTPVWHCPGCDHHWLIGDDECRNCHFFERLEDGTVARIEAEDPDEEDGDEEDQDEQESIGEEGEPVSFEFSDPIFVLDGSSTKPTRPTSRPTFNQTNENVEWAWWTWNPVTGCEHNCIYCYARDIANRFYPEKFEPTFRPERLEAPRNTHPPEKSAVEIGWKNVFVCSMADLFGRWVPEEWIDGVFESCRKSPEWNYLFLTKFPLRYEGLDFPSTAWVGTSVDEQKRVANAEKAFKKVDAPIKWLSVEPLRERLHFAHLDLFDWIVIGGQSRSSGAPEFLPPFEWVAELVTEAKSAGCKVYIKPNIGFDGPTRPREYPGMSPIVEVPAGSRVKVEAR
jgi:protein gp37